MYVDKISVTWEHIVVSTSWGGRSVHAGTVTLTTAVPQTADPDEVAARLLADFPLAGDVRDALTTELAADAHRSRRVRLRLPLRSGGEATVSGRPGGGFRGYAFSWLLPRGGRASVRARDRAGIDPISAAAAAMTTALTAAAVRGSYRQARDDGGLRERKSDTWLAQVDPDRAARGRLRLRRTPIEVRAAGAGDAQAVAHHLRGIDAGSRQRRRRAGGPDAAGDVQRVVASGLQVLAIGPAGRLGAELGCVRVGSTRSATLFGSAIESWQGWAGERLLLSVLARPARNAGIEQLVVPGWDELADLFELLGGRPRRAPTLECVLPLELVPEPGK